MNKAVIFDGDGTLWRPVGQSGDVRPDAIYQGNRVEEESYLKLQLIAGVPEMLSHLRARGYKIFIVSAHPVPGELALKELQSKTVELGIDSLVDGLFCSNGKSRDGKADVIRGIVDNSKLDPSQTYMVGDSYYYDYEAGKKAGINSFFIKNNYCKQPSPLPRGVSFLEKITDIESVLGLI